MGVRENPPDSSVGDERDVGVDPRLGSAGRQQERAVEEVWTRTFPRRRVLRELKPDLRAVGRGLAGRGVVHLQLDDAARFQPDRRSRAHHLRVGPGAHVASRRFGT